MYQNHPTKNHESFFLKLGILINREHEPDLWVEDRADVNLGSPLAGFVVLKIVTSWSI